MAAGFNPLVDFWSGRGIHVTVSVSFAVQVTLLLLADIRRRADWPVLRAIIWSAYMLADTTAIYALGHLSVVVTSPEHRLMALWAPLLLVHLGGQDNITAYAIEDNRLWLRHLQTFGLQLLAAGYVLYASSILFLPSLLRSAAILMYVVGVLKYGERVCALIGANSCASSNLVITSYKDFGAEAAARVPTYSPYLTSEVDMGGDVLVLDMAHSLLDIPKKMFEGPTSYVTIENETRYPGIIMLEVVHVQLTMMYDLLYTKVVVHTWYGFIVRLISLPFTVAVLKLFYALKDEDGYRRADIIVTKVLLIGAVVLEAISVLRFMFSMWTAALLYKRTWYSLGWVLHYAELVFSNLVRKIVQSDEIYWSGHMRQHNLFKVFLHTNSSRGSRIAKRMGLEDMWDSTFCSRSTRVPRKIIGKVLVLVSATESRQDVPSGETGTEARQVVVPLSDDTATGSRQAVPSVDTGTEARQVVPLSDGIGTEASQIDIKKSRGRNALRRGGHEELAWSVGLDLDESILVWHIATHVYLESSLDIASLFCSDAMLEFHVAMKALCNYMFYLLIARPYMLPYPVTRQRYVQLCHDCNTHLSTALDIRPLTDAIKEQKEALIRGSPIQPNADGRIAGDSQSGGTAQTSINSTLDLGCKLAAQLVDTAQRDPKDVHRIPEMVFEVWAEMLCYTAYNCNEKSHAKNLTNGGELMTIVALMMLYKSNGFIMTENSSATASTSSSA